MHAAVHFPEKLCKIIVTETKNAYFECKVCHDGLKGQWFKDGMRVNEEVLPRFRISCDGYVHCLQISDVLNEDAGLYVYQVGHMSTSARLIVNGKESSITA